MQKITIRGKEYALALTVGAFSEICGLCPGQDFGRIDELLNAPTGQAMETTARMIAIMSKGAEEQKALENSEYSPSPLTFDAIRTLPLAEFSVVYRSFGHLLTESMKGQTVETAPSKKKGEKAEK